MSGPVSLSRVAGSAPATGMAKGQLAALAQLTTQMRAIRRDTQMPEEMKKKQLAMLREQTQAIQQTVTDRLDNRKRADLVASTAEAAQAAQQGDETREAGDATAQPATDTAAAPSGNAAASPTPASPTLGSIVDTYV